MWWPCGWEALGVAYQPSSSAVGSSLPPLSRPQLAEACRVRAVELFEEGVSSAEIARAVGVYAESVRRWRRAWEKGDTSALRRRAAPGQAGRRPGRENPGRFAARSPGSWVRGQG
ncbi:helix-turn-helix domain-containing protein [Streptomyces sp. NPDC098789]|uniref:helix-turn-helix domain-containing protein n=1 Tax=Streptomyces sp. NPDC098789 TaxID=3366098 RepID=UPI00380175DB